MKALLLMSLIGVALAADWGYVGEYGPDHWTKLSTVCGANRQSPIDIPHADKGVMYQDMGQFTMTGYDSITAGNLELKNNGHSVVVSIKDTNVVQPRVSGGGLSGTYQAVQLHFHWGRTNMEGSEHTFRGNKYPLEMHIVHFKTDYNDLTSALAESDGVAVLGYFFVISDDDNANLAPIVAELDNLVEKDATRDVTLDFTQLMSAKMDEWYRYEGSLTTPTCNEAVIWTVFENKNTISSAQLNKFRNIKDASGHKVEFNYRPVQMLKDRPVYKNYENAVPDSFHWGYHGHEAPVYWPAYYPTCRGDGQSPINIPAFTDVEMAQYDPSLQLNTLEVHGHTQWLTGTIKNNGHTIQVDIENENVYMEYGGLMGKYRAAQFHFHWGHTNDTGSEHTREGKAYPLELHIVHFKEEYGSIGNSLNRDDGLAVLGVFIEIGDDINEGYSKVVSKLPDVQFKDQTQVISNFTIEGLTHKDMQSGPGAGIHMPYFRYRGGLTTPPCSQVVTWSVLQTAVQVSAAQLEEFRKMTHVKETAGSNLHAKDYITENYRPTQSLQYRRVYSSHDGLKAIIDGAPAFVQSTLTTSLALCILALLR